nr:hypothetical protein CFP56_00466 [Quercus suber]
MSLRSSLDDIEFRSASRSLVVAKALDGLSRSGQALANVRKKKALRGEAMNNYSPISVSFVTPTIILSSAGSHWSDQEYVEAETWLDPTLYTAQAIGNQLCRRLACRGQSLRLGSGAKFYHTTSSSTTDRDALQAPEDVA